MMRAALLLFALVFLFAVAARAPAADQPPSGKPQTACPVLNYPVNQALHVDYQGKRIYFCCDGCQKDFMKSPDAYIKKMEDQGVVLEKTPDTK
jgi:YHS domain-containing protein